MRLNAEALAKRLAPPAAGGLTGVIEKVAGGAQGDDFMSRLHATIDNFKGLVEGARTVGLDVRGDAAGGLDLAALAKLLIAQGYGDAPLGKLAKMVEGVTLKQLEGLLGGNRSER